MKLKLDEVTIKMTRREAESIIEDFRDIPHSYMGSDLMDLFRKLEMEL